MNAVPRPPAARPEVTLERGGVVRYPACPFPLPAGDDLRFLLAQELGPGHKNISYTPGTKRLRGFRHQSAAATDRLHGLLTAFARHGADWLAAAFPGYAAACAPDQVTFRPEEEAGR